MSKLEIAARQALEALEEIHAGNMTPMAEENWKKAITALREALAEQERKAKYDERFERLEKFEQAEQEPVAYAPIITFCDAQHYSVSKQKKPEYCNPLYAAPVRTKDLTDDEIYKLADDVDWAAGAYLGFARAVIAADREKNRG